MENVLRNIKPGMTDAQTLKAMRVTVWWSSRCACWSMPSACRTAPSMKWVAVGLEVPLVGAFVPLVCGLYWKRATTQAGCRLWCPAWCVADLRLHARLGRGFP